jgi:hypothetical protein
MNASNRFEIETLARQHQAELEHRLRTSTQLRSPQPAPVRTSAEARVRIAAIMAGAGVMSLLIAFGLSNAIAYAISNLANSAATTFLR